MNSVCRYCGFDLVVSVWRESHENNCPQQTIDVPVTFIVDLRVRIAVTAASYDEAVKKARAVRLDQYYPETQIILDNIERQIRPDDL